MLKIQTIYEIIKEPIIKIRGTVETGEYFEIRKKGKWLDVRASKEEGFSMRTIYREKFDSEITFEEILKYLEINIDNIKVM